MKNNIKMAAMHAFYPASAFSPYSPIIVLQCGSLLMQPPPPPPTAVENNYRRIFSVFLAPFFFQIRKLQFIVAEKCQLRTSNSQLFIIIVGRYLGNTYLLILEIFPNTMKPL